MEIILLERVENLGQMGDLVTVKPGYARNFLLPKGKAIRATAENRAKFDAERAQLEAENLARKSEAEKVAEKMEGLSVNLIRAASEMGQLYGSATSRDIAKETSNAGFTVSKGQIDLNTALKTLGIFPVRITLHPEVSVEIRVNIARSEDEATEQLRLGRAIVSDTAEREREEAAEAAAEAEARMIDQEAEEQEAGEEEATDTESSEKKTAAKTKTSAKKKSSAKKSAVKSKAAKTKDAKEKAPKAKSAKTKVSAKKSTTKAKSTKAEAPAGDDKEDDK
jgi:large subunit ribosomal protein L9